MATTVDAAEKINRAKGAIKSSVTKLETFLENAEKASVTELQIKIKKIGQLQKKLDELLNEFFLIKDLSGLQDTANDFEQVDSRLEELEVRITSILESRKSSSNPKNQTVESIKNEVRLPEIPLPTFSGAFSEWESFKTQFTTLVSNNDNLDDNQKLFYLRASLKGEAKQLESTEDTFNSLFDALKERFENQRLLIDFHVLSILHYDKIQQESARELRSLIDCIKKNIRGLKVQNYEQNNLSEILLVNIILQKLDKESRRQFEFSLKSSEVPQFDSLMSFLERRSSILESVSRIPSAVKTTFPAKNAARNNSLNNPIKQKSLMIKSNNKGNFKACICCNNFHPLYKCISFKNMSVEKRKEFVSVHRVCELCFRKHAGSCSSKFKCFVKGCQMAHNTLLHEEEKALNEISATSAAKNNNDISSPKGGSDDLEQSYSLLLESEDINKTMQNFWNIESVGESSHILNSEEELCEKHFLENYSRTPEGRYIVKIPLKNDKQLGESRTSANRRLDALWRRLSKDTKLKTLYCDFIREYKVLGHMTEVKEAHEPEFSVYLPHHGVYNPLKSSTKLRVVFNGSAPTSNGVSLNQIQLNGGTVQQDLFSIMIRFRKHEFVFTADVRMMYRQILIHPDQRDLQRIVWKEGPDQPTKDYQLNTITYGTTSAPYLATRTLNQLAIDEKDTFPDASIIVQSDCYMDDILTGSNSLENTKELQTQLVQLLGRGGMTLHKWCSNNESLLNSIQNSGDYQFNNPAEMKPVKTLGVLWKPNSDCFSFKVTISQQHSYTKRSILSDISRIYDPLGLIGPVVSKAKIFMQRLWLLKVGWDEPLPEDVTRAWIAFVSLLPCIEQLEIPRHFPSDNTVIIHGFADASTAAYGAAIYVQCPSSESKSTYLLCSKSHVAPIKPVTIPRLELCAALLLSQLTQRVIKALNLTISAVLLYSDSTIVLAWMKKPPQELKTFVCHRVTAIQELTKDFHWRHVPSEENPADFISRGVTPDSLQLKNLWWNGPSFLRNGIEIKELSESDPITDNDFICELKQSEKCSLLTNSECDSVFSQLISISNNYMKLINILSYVFRFISNCKKGVVPKSGPISSDEYKDAEVCLLRWAQAQDFPSEIQTISKGKQLPGKNCLKSLNPFLDNNNLLRVGGRLINAKVNYDQKHQIILPAKDNLTRLILEHIHKKYLHVGPQTLLYLTRQKFWPINGRNLARKVVHNCVTCVKNKPVIVKQLMGNPPSERVNVSAPFSNTGVDFAGPFLIKYKGQRKGTLHKVYVAIFVCMSTKAVHIEMVTDLTSEAFISTLKRFFARRGKCSTLFSDNATNFVGAQAELKKLHNLINYPDDNLSNFLASDAIKWKFIPPVSPNFGGLWEAGVKSFKHHFRRAIGNANLTYEEFNTVIVEIEGILNSRPITEISSDINDLEALTPGHFLIGRPINTVAEPELINVSDNRLSRWQRVEKLTQHIWKRWSSDYLNHFQQRQKWQFVKNNVKPGMMVILKEDNLPKCKWALGRIIDVMM
ncbi:hypothetical protein AVEN_78349-1 [Araneus ventricosus]|uniref:Integrase catalytic domain-containing protein n=1 Tax=Araneus ventricosus TaxID=182803 RepID=A0A4Y2DAJ2_ARAVE|nr:hypothetical protein AVEN_78349-1 [Araneus ventricosus]